MKKLYNVNRKGVVIHVDRTKLSEHLSFQKMFIPTWLWLSLCVAIVIASYSEERKASDVHSLRITTEYVTDFTGNGNVEVIETSKVHPFRIKEEYTQEDIESGPILYIYDDGSDEEENEEGRLSFGQHNETTAQEYIKLYLAAAKHQENKHNIPVAITLAQGLHESNAGNSRLAREENNHFGIKCFSKSCKKGHCVNYADDSHKDFFMSFRSAWSCFNYRSQFLHKDRYKHLMKLKKTDYKGWANGLQKAGYATDKNYAKKLIRTIEKYNLHKL
jgi:hypothetical protein